MQHPVQRIRHIPLASRWPTAQEAAASRLFSPLHAGQLHLADRTWVPAMVPWRATDDGLVTDDVLGWYERFAQGQPGTIVVEATGIRDIPSGPLLRIGDDRFIPGLRRLVDTVRRASGGRTKLFIQIIDFLSIRRRPARETYLGRYLTITDAHRRAVAGSELDFVAAEKSGPIAGSAGSDREPTEAAASGTNDPAVTNSSSDPAIRAALLAMPDERLREVLTPREIEAMDFGLRERVTDVEQPHIRDLPKTLPGIFAAAARRAEAAGFDGVELHFAHAYTMASFLSARNTRPDGYGGPRELRVRLPIEVFRAVRATVSDRFVVGCRYLSDDCIEAGSSVDDAVFFGLQFALAGMDFLSLSRGGKFEDAKQPKVGWAAYPYTGPSGWECMPTVLGDEAGPFGRNVEPARRIRQTIRDAGLTTPVAVAGGIHTFDQAESILAAGAADIIGAARQSLADPDWYLKMRSGRGDEIRRCSFTNYCEGLDQMHKQVTCKLWDREALDEPGIPKSSDGRRRLLAPAWEWDAER
jgi:2,4-dienoyl-CoA reductase-like NADH-dependent reductase (Old Yellow Enzyme family)